MITKGSLWPLFLNSIVCLKIINIYAHKREEYKMVMLTINGLKAALEFIQANSRTIFFITEGHKKGFIASPEGTNEEGAYHLRVVQMLKPTLITRLAPDYTVLSLDGQELLDILSDKAYLDSLVERLKACGYTAPSDRQVFRLLQERMNIMPVTDVTQTMSLPDVFNSFFDAALSANGRAKVEVSVEEVPQKEVQVQEQLELDFNLSEPVNTFEPPYSKAAELIERTKDDMQENTGV